MPFNLASMITANQLLLGIPCFKFVVLQLAINDDFNQLLLSMPCFKVFALQFTANDHYQPVFTQYALLQPLCPSICRQWSLLSSYYSVSSLLHCNLTSTISSNQLLLGIPCFKFAVLHLPINHHSWPPVSQYSLLQVCCTSTCLQRSLLTSYHSVFLVSKLLPSNLPSTITTTGSQLLPSISGFKFIVLHFVINDHP